MAYFSGCTGREKSVPLNVHLRRLGRVRRARFDGYIMCTEAALELVVFDDFRPCWRRDCFGSARAPIADEVVFRRTWGSVFCNN